MRRAITLVVLSICGAGLTVALATAQPEPAPAPDPTVDVGDLPEAPAAPPREYTPEDLARRAKVVVKVGARAITVGDVEDEVNKQSPFLRARYMEPDRLREFVHNLVRFELLSAEAERRGYQDNPDVVRQVKQNAVQQLMRIEFNERITPESIPAADVQAYYDAHPEEFNREELRRASHVLFETREQAQQKLAEARAADARAFRQLARDHSIDRETKLRGGDLRYFNPEGKASNAPDLEVDAALVRAAFSLAEVGDVSDPVQVGEHFSIVKLTGRRPAEHRTLEQADHQIRLRLWREQRQQAIRDFVERLRNQANPEVFEQRMEAIVLEAAEPAGEGEGPPIGPAGPGKRPPGLPPPGMPGPPREAPEGAE